MLIIWLCGILKNKDLAKLSECFPKDGKDISSTMKEEL